MLNQLAKIDGLDMQTGVGQALFDDPVNPTKRYFLEKRWAEEGKILGVIMMNPSKAGALEGDKTVDGLIKLAKAKKFSALYVVNIIPYICSNPKELPKVVEDMITESKQIKSVEFVLSKSDRILLAWGKKGHEYLPELLKDIKIRSLLLNNKDKCQAISFNITKRFPVHPRPRGIDKYNLDTLGVSFKFEDASNKLTEWINKFTV